MLAGLISNPDAPTDPRSNPETALARRNMVLQNMADQGYITQDEYQQYAQAAPPEALADPTPGRRTRRRPTSPPGCASSWSTSTAPARRSAAGSRSSPRSTSPLQNAVQQIARRAHRRRRA